MFIRSIASLALLASAAAAQTMQADAPTLETAAGYYTYDCATHTLTQNAGPSALRATTGTLYNNSLGAINATPAWWTSTMSGEIFTTSPGQIPATSSIAPFTGTMDRHTVTSYTIGYMSAELGVPVGGPGTSITVSFWDNMTSACPTIAALGTPVYTETLTGLPGATTVNVIRGIYFVTVIPAMPFRLNADSDQVFDNDVNLDDFGFSMQFNSQATSTLVQAFKRVYGGGYQASATPTNQGDDTYYKNPTAVIAPYLATESATGLGDHFWVLDWNGQTPPTGGTAAGCLWLGAAPVQGQWNIYLRMDGLLDDCNGNKLPDDEEIELGAPDANLNGIPDACECGTWLTYCTSGASSHGCVPVLSAAGTPSGSAPSGFVVTATVLEAGQNGLFFYGISGRVAAPWGPSGSFQCVKGPLDRGAVGATGGTTPTACDGSLSVDWTAYVFGNPTALGKPFLGGEVVNIQAWYRDPPSPKTSAMSGGLEFVVCP